MANTYAAIMKRDGDWWIGWIEEVPGVNCQEKTREALLKSCRRYREWTQKRYLGPGWSGDEDGPLP
jgi:hypothetical protein